MTPQIFRASTLSEARRAAEAEVGAVFMLGGNGREAIGCCSRRSHLQVPNLRQGMAQVRATVPIPQMN